MLTRFSEAKAPVESLLHCSGSVMYLSTLSCIVLTHEEKIIVKGRWSWSKQIKKLTQGRQPEFKLLIQILIAILIKPFRDTVLYA